MSKSRLDLQCSICEEPFDGIYQIAGSDYENLVCQRCDQRAVTEAGSDPKCAGDQIAENSEGEKVIQMAPDVGDNPVYIDGEKCWRLYKFGGFITLWDQYDCDSLEAFREKQLQQVSP